MSTTQKAGGLLNALSNKKAKAPALDGVPTTDAAASDKKAILFRLDIGDWRRLKSMAVDSDSSLQAMLEESVNEWLAKRGLAPIGEGRKK